jgi:hypothetical protein
MDGMSATTEQKKLPTPILVFGRDPALANQHLRNFQKAKNFLRGLRPQG